MRREKYQGFIECGRRKCRRLCRSDQKNGAGFGTFGQSENRCRDGRRCSAAPQGISRSRHRDQQYGHGRTAFSEFSTKCRSANVYLGAEPLVEALEKGAQIIVGGRLTDTGLTLAPLMYEFGWKFGDWDKVATGTIAGHIIECGAQCSGGNCQFDWQNIPDMANVGFPIVEAYPNGDFVITKHEGTGGRINIPSIKEQLLYEMGDPHSYITPDVVADFTTINLKDDGENRVKVFGIKGKRKHGILQSFNRVFGRLESRRNARLFLSRCI